VKGLAKVYRYRASEEFMAANSIVYRLKKKNRKDALDFLADEMVNSIKASLPELSSNAIITHVPNRKSAIVQYGFDHAELLGRAVAEKLGLEFMPLLTSLSKKPKKEMQGGEEE
jgi:predicted amidophosphoribosyltransferase